MRLGIFGGSFDPVHYGHLLLAEAAREEARLDEVWFVPVAISPHKVSAQAEEPAAGEHRAAMLELAVAWDPRLVVDRLELQRGGVSYTVETMRLLREKEPDTEWFLIVGGDIVPELPQWKSAEELPELARVVVITRGNADGAGRLPYPGRSTLVRVPDLEVSSTAIRERVAAGRSIRYWVPPAVEAYIREHGLYREVDPSASIELAPSGG